MKEGNVVGIWVRFRYAFLAFDQNGMTVFFPSLGSIRLCVVQWALLKGASLVSGG
jgi:hypothetical protein